MKDFEFVEKKKLERVRERLAKLLTTDEKEKAFLRVLRKLLHEE